MRHPSHFIREVEILISWGSGNQDFCRNCGAQGHDLTLPCTAIKDFPPTMTKQGLKKEKDLAK